MKLRSRSFSKSKNGPLLYKHNMIGPKSQSVWPGAFLHLTPEPDFSQTCTFTRIINVTVMHDLNPKNLHINGVFFLTKCKKNFFFFLHYPQNAIFSQKSSCQFFPLTHWHTDILTVVKSSDPFRSKEWVQGTKKENPQEILKWRLETEINKTWVHFPAKILSTW